jgi:four helix bundle protein
MDNNVIKTKSRQFTVKIVQLYKHLSNNKKEIVMSEKLLRAGTSIGANLAKAECAATKNGFVAKIQEALEECAEARYWLEILNESEFITEFEFKNNIQDCNELRKILSYTIKSLTAAQQGQTPSATPKPSDPTIPPVSPGSKGA